jgi:hypothetical protein
MCCRGDNEKLKRTVSCKSRYRVIQDLASLDTGCTSMQLSAGFT